MSFYKDLRTQNVRWKIFIPAVMGAALNGCGQAPEPESQSATADDLRIIESDSGQPYQQLARELLQELVEIDTTHSTGNTTVAAQAMAARLVAAGFP